MSGLVVDEGQIASFTDAVFRYASEGKFVSLRSFLDSSKDGPPVAAQAVKINGSGLDSVVSAAVRAAQSAADHRKGVVFCPPLATFSNSESAREADLAEAFTISIECDARPGQALAFLRGVLGPPTAVVWSGGEWANPETGEIEPKLHLHWRLTEAATSGELAKLKQVRKLATALVGADPTNITPVHPIRWPGSWHRKSEPRLACLKELNPASEIDLSDAIERLEEVTPPESKGLGPKPANDDRQLADHVRSLSQGDNLHDSIARVAASWVGSGMHPGAAVNSLRGVMEASAAPRDARWQSRYDDIPRAVSTAQAKFSLPYHSRFEAATGTALKLVNPAIWAGRTPPERKWSWRDWVPRQQATYFTGGGSTGKSLATQQLATAVALGRPFLGVETTAASSIYITCEDDMHELHRRQDAICEAFDVDFEALSGRLHLASLAGEIGNELATFDAENRMHTTPAWDRLREAVLANSAGFVVLDNVAHLFAGNENIRNHVAAFCGLLNGLARDADAAILFIGHPNKAGGEFSGSTAWENQVRSRLFLSRPAQGEHGLDYDEDARVLSRGKSNYAKHGEKIFFRWYRWAFVREQDLDPSTASSLTAHLLAKTQDERFLSCLARATAEKRATSPNSSASNYAPRVFAKMPSGAGIGVAGFEAALQRLLHLGTILNGQSVYRRDNRAWVTGLGVAPTLAPTPAQTDAHECTNHVLSD